MKKHKKKPIPLRSYIEVSDLCRDGWCLSEKLREQKPTKEYVHLLSKAIGNLNNGEFYGTFVFLVGALKNLEEQEHLNVPHRPSYREQADRYYKILRECKRSGDKLAKEHGVSP